MMKFAAAWGSGLSAKIEKRLEKPFFLRDGLVGWYAHFFRHVQELREDQLELIAPLNRLMQVYLIWLGGVCKTLPVDLRNATALAEVRSEAAAHYAELTDLVSQLAVLDDDAARNELYEDNVVYRNRNSSEAVEAEVSIKRIASGKKELARRISAQTTLNRRMGGAAAMEMLYAANEAAQQERDALRERYEEAVRRIDHAETIAAPEDQYRITDARTKLARMERHRVMLESKCEQIQGDVAQAESEGLRFDHPAMTPAPAENHMFLPEMGELLLNKDRLSAGMVDKLWSRMVLPGQTGSLRQCLRATKHVKVRQDAPLAGFIQAMIESAMKEV